MTIRHLLSAAVAAVVVCLASTQAAADTITDTTGLIDTDFSQTLSLEQFGPALGTLT